MKKLILLAGIAAMAMPVSAYATSTGGCRYNCGGDSDWDSSGSFNEDTDIDVEYDNDLDASIDVDVEYDKDVSLRGHVNLRGNINVNSSAVAFSDPKLIVEKNEVDGGDWDYKNGARPAATNTTQVDSVGGNGNIGVNAVAGQNNVQANTGAIATAPGGNANDRPDHNPKKDGSYDRDGNAGWAEASTIALQKVWDNDFDGGKTSNTAKLGDVKGNGNIGVNVASGAFNNQANVLTMAVVKDGALAEANVGALLISLENDTNVAAGSTNHTEIHCIEGNGNVGVNVATGVGNIQHNSLTIATSVHR